MLYVNLMFIFCWGCGWSRELRLDQSGLAWICRRRRDLQVTGPSMGTVALDAARRTIHLPCNALCLEPRPLASSFILDHQSFYAFFCSFSNHKDASSSAVSWFISKAPAEALLRPRLIHDSRHREPGSTPTIKFLLPLKQHI